MSNRFWHRQPRRITYALSIKLSIPLNADTPGLIETGSLYLLADAFIQKPSKRLPTTNNVIALAFREAGL